MKYLIFVFACLISVSLFAQETPGFNFTPKIEKIVIEIDSMSQQDVYTKILNWVQITYENPEEVLKANIPNELIRINGYAKNVFGWEQFGAMNYYDVKYSLEMEVKESRIRLSYWPKEFYVANSGQKCLFGYDLFFTDQKDNKRGREAKEKIDKALIEFERSVNNLVNNLYDYLLETTDNTDDDW
jgi:hypothetical protein